MKKLSLFLTAGLIAGCMAFPAAAEEDKTWVIATDTVFKPFEYTDESGNFVGIDVDIVAAIAEDQGFHRCMPGRSGRWYDRRCIHH